MGQTFSLPSEKKQREFVITQLSAEGVQLRNLEQVKWYVASFYMRGERSFAELDYANGTVALDYMNDSGVLKFKYEEILARYQAQLGRLGAIDISPSVKTKSVGLDGLRKASTAQIVLDAAFPQDKVEKLSAELGPPLLHFGTIGLCLWHEDEDSFGIEVVPPWELVPLPINPNNATATRGLMRIRWVPKEWIQNLAITPGKNSKVYKGVDSVEVNKGKGPEGIRDAGTAFLSMNATGAGFGVKVRDIQDEGSSNVHKKKKNEILDDMTLLVEVWTETSDGYLAEYAIYVGSGDKKELYHHDHSDHKYPMPIRTARDITVNSFWGRSFVEMLIPLNQELEYALGSLFQAVAEFDLYGILAWPSTLGTPQEAIRGADGLRKLVYEQDYTCPEAKPFPIQPAKLTGPQYQAVQMAVSLFNNLTNQPNELMSGDAPGRVDNTPSLGLLYETSQIPLSPTAKSIAMAVSGVYRALLRILKDTWSQQKVVGVSKLDDSLAGIVLDPEAGTISMDNNSIPYPDEVVISIRSIEPVSKEQMKMELKDARAQQVLTPEEYAFEVRKKGLDLPVGHEIEWHNYRRAMLENLVLFGNGEKPGKITVAEHDNHRIHSQVLLSFMSRPEYFVASVEVKNAFTEHLKEHQVQDGDYQEQLPYPEDVAGMMGEEGMPSMNMPM